MKIDEQKLKELIDNCHPVSRCLDLSGHEMDAALEADSTAMQLVHNRHSKRALVDLVRFLLLNIKEGKLPTL